MKLGVLGAGAWGAALAHVARTAGHEVQVWSRGSPLGPFRDAQGLILAVPAQGVSEVLSGLKSIVTNCGNRLPLIISAKGIEQGTGLFMNEVVAEVLPQANISHAHQWAEALSLPHFRIYASDDVKGVEIGGALKNVLAIACGISDGRGQGDSARAALTTRGFAELTRFAAKLGAKPDTLMGLSGLGDLLLTCSSRQSRNYSFGYALGEGKTVEQALAASRGVVEGAATVKIAQALARRHGVDMPIVDAVHAIVDEGRAPDQEIARLLARPLRAEIR